MKRSEATEVSSGPRPRHPQRMMGILCLALVMAAALSLQIGSTALHSLDSALASEIFWRLRWPRTLTAIAVGGLLALSGTLMQTLTRNPLADPYLFGVASSAAVGAMLALWWQVPDPGTQVGAITGAVAALILVLTLSRRGWSVLSLTMTGVAVSSMAGALIVLILTFAPEPRLRGILFWMIGDIGLAVNVWPVLAVLLVTLVVSFLMARPLSVLEHDDQTALAIGVHPRWWRIAAFLVASITCALAVTTAGVVGFVGLIAPHMARLMLGGSLRHVLPGSVLTGATLLVLADMVSRWVIAPQQLPIGILTTLLGVPLFLYLLRRG